MTSIGRGRGWARPAERESILRRPGQPSSPKTTEFDELVDRIYNILHIEESSPASKVRDLANFMESLGDSQSPEDLADKLLKLALEDRCFGMKVMKIYSNENKQNISTKTNFQLRMRNNLLKMMQEYYEKKEEWRKENPSHLSNLVWIFGVIIETFESNILVCHIGPALVNCCNLLLDTATEEDTEAVAVQIYLNAKCIVTAYSTADKRTNPPDTKELNEIINKARTILVNRNVSARTRALLLLIIDCANLRYEPLTGDLQAFYASVLGGSRAQESDSQFRTGREFNSEAYLYGILTKGMTLPKNENHAVTGATHESTRNKLPPQQVQKINRGPNGGGSGPMPRAIRGSGASESSKEHKNDKRSPRGHKEKLTDEQVWSAKQNTGSKVWGHDDRFDNDYEQNKTITKK